MRDTRSVAVAVATGETIHNKDKKRSTRPGKVTSQERGGKNKMRKDCVHFVFEAIVSTSHYASSLGIGEKLLTQTLKVDDWFLSTLLFGRTSSSL
jgi:hypothetical protein